MMAMLHSSSAAKGQPAQPEQAFIAFGANMGNCLRTFINARQRLSESGVSVVHSSSLYLTQAVGGPSDQPDYLNAVVEVSTTLSAPSLLALCLQLETQAGRQRLQHWGPRTLDLDLLLFGHLVCDSEALIVPHPRLHQRRFVLEPLCEIAGEKLHPLLGVSYNHLLRQLLEDASQPRVMPSELIW